MVRRTEDARSTEPCAGQRAQQMGVASPRNRSVCAKRRENRQTTQAQATEIPKDSGSLRAGEGLGPWIPFQTWHRSVQVRPHSGGWERNTCEVVNSPSASGFPQPLVLEMRNETYGPAARVSTQDPPPARSPSTLGPDIAFFDCCMVTFPKHTRDASLRLCSGHPISTGGSGPSEPHGRRSRSAPASPQVRWPCPSHQHTCPRSTYRPGRPPAPPPGLFSPRREDAFSVLT